MATHGRMGSRIAARLEELGMRPADLLRLVPDLNAGTLSAIIVRDAAKSKFSDQIAEALRVTHRWLVTGEGPKEIGASEIAQIVARELEAREVTEQAAQMVLGLIRALPLRSGTDTPPPPPPTLESKKASSFSGDGRPQQKTGT